MYCSSSESQVACIHSLKVQLTSFDFSYWQLEVGHSDTYSVLHAILNIQLFFTVEINSLCVASFFNRAVALTIYVSGLIPEPF